MHVREANAGDIESLAGLMREFFPEHNVFTGTDEDVHAYLSRLLKEHACLVAEQDGELRGGMFIVRKGGDGEHSLYKFRHFAFSDHESACALFSEAEKRIRATGKTAKIENTLAEDEKGIEEYEKQGYIHEATLSDHYRMEESCLIYSKILTCQEAGQSDAAKKDSSIGEKTHCACGDASMTQDCCGE